MTDESQPPTHEPDDYAQQDADWHRRYHARRKPLPEPHQLEPWNDWNGPLPPKINEETVDHQ
jgi:hypothetical protein